MNGAKLLSSVRDPEELHQWLEVEQFSKTLQQWHEKDVNIDGDLVPAKVLIVFRELVEKSIVSCNLSSEFGGDSCEGNHHTHRVFGWHGQKLSKALQNQEAFKQLQWHTHTCIEDRIQWFLGSLYPRCYSFLRNLGRVSSNSTLAAQLRGSPGF